MRNGNAAQTEQKPEEANESTACKRTDIVTRFEGEAFGIKQSRICQEITKPEKENTREFLQRLVSVRQAAVSATKIIHLNGAEKKNYKLTFGKHILIRDEISDLMM
ncbi:hypothetical protein PoB_005332200 [Plakobranchus ocellatus]|uniref:Uncharacterized protein n=1 Tax=Plakobranchus ocellatus TaxID=259542 RepID=A0AAV4C5F6_9GAST|nr:hypothetical protein PoB_005332200 [Plakobranchus ocellatus]